MLDPAGGLGCVRGQTGGCGVDGGAGGVLRAGGAAGDFLLLCREQGVSGARQVAAGALPSLQPCRTPNLIPEQDLGRENFSPRATPGMLGAGEAAAPNLTPRKSQTKVTGMVLGTSPCWRVTPMGPRPPQSHHGHDLATSLAQPPSNASTPSDQSPLVAEPRAHTQHSFGVLLPSLLPAPRLQPPKHLPFS